MSHNKKIIDDDPCFEVDAITRAIKDMSSSKITVMQNDHNSERFTFTLPRYVEGHDLMECTKAEVHYINVDVPDIYTIDDLAIDEADESKVKCTWLLSSNATGKVGVLQFNLRFSCVAEDGSIEYAWNTGIYKDVSISTSIFNTDVIVEQNPDALAQMEKALENELSKYVDETILGGAW